MNLLKEFKQYIQKENLFDSGHQLLVAVSGGQDSMVLLHLLLHEQYNIHVAHANFNLRNQESEADEDLVKIFCHENNIPFHTKKFDTHLQMNTGRQSLQEAARFLRYNWFNELLTEFKLDYILTGHHANDLAETILFNLVRGTGIKGLAGIKSKHENIRRPILFATKEQLYNFTSNHNILFRNDRSNEMDIYTRNYIRHHIIPPLLEINPAFVSQINHFSHIMLAGSYYYQKGLQQTIHNIVIKNGVQTVIDLQRLLLEPYPDQVLYELLNPKNFNFIQCSQILLSFKKNNTGALFLTPSHQALLNRKQLIITTYVDEFIPHIFDQFPFCLTHGENEVEFDLLKNSNSLNFAPGILYLNADLLIFPLTVRLYKQGDKFTPLGMSNLKKISDYLTNKKIDRFSKEKTLVIAHKDGTIIAIIPYQISDVFKVTDDCKNVIRIRIKKRS